MAGDFSLYEIQDNRENLQRKEHHSNQQEFWIPEVIKQRPEVALTEIVPGIDSRRKPAQKNSTRKQVVEITKREPRQDKESRKKDY